LNQFWFKPIIPPACVLDLPDSQFNFMVDLDYASFKYEGTNFNFNKKIVKSTSKYYEGFYGKTQGGGQVNIKVSYGSVSFIEN